MGQIFDFLLVNPILNALMALYRVTGNLGISIITLTVVIRTILIPAMAPALKTMKKQRELQPQIDKLKSKYGSNKQELAKAQMELFKEHGINPASGCLTQIVMITVLIALYNVIRKFTVSADINSLNSSLYFDWLKLAEGAVIQTKFLYMNLAKPDPYYIVAVLSGVLQFFSGKMMMPYVEQAEKAAKKTPDKKDDFAYAMQQQTTYFLPIMNVMIGITLPAGVMLYIIATTIFSMVQNYFATGWGGLKPLIDKLNFTAKKV